MNLPTAKNFKMEEQGMRLRRSEMERDEPRMSDRSKTVLLRGEGNETVAFQFHGSVDRRNCGYFAFLQSFDISLSLVPL